MNWMERLNEIGHNAANFIVVSLLTGLWLLGRKLFTDSARLDALEVEMKNRTDRHNELRDEVKEVRADVKDGFDRIDGKLTRIVENMLK